MKKNLINVQVVMKAIIYLQQIPVGIVKLHVKHVQVKIHAIPVLIIIFFLQINAINAMWIVNQELMTVNAKIVMMVIICIIINV